MLQLPISQEVIDRLPSPHGVALALSDVCRRKNFHLEDVCSLVRTDPALSGRLLFMANAATSGGRGISSVDEVVYRLGVVTVCQIALAFSLIDQHSNGSCANFDYAGFWSHSILMASASRELGTVLHLGSAGELFTVGLLSHIGQLGLATAFPSEYSELIVISADRAELLVNEQKLSKTNQLQLSVAMMEHWGVPTDFARPFGYRETTRPALERDCDLIRNRAHLAHKSSQISTTLARDGVVELLKPEQFELLLSWLKIEGEYLMDRVEKIESTWRLWTGLMANSHYAR